MTETIILEFFFKNGVLTAKYMANGPVNKNQTIIPKIRYENGI